MTNDREFDEMEPGECIGNHSARAKACKICEIAEQCKEETKKDKSDGVEQVQEGS